MFAAKSKEMNFTHCYPCKLSRRILIVKWGNAMQSGPLGCGTWKRWLRNVWRLVCSLKYNWKSPGWHCLVSRKGQHPAPSSLHWSPVSIVGHPDTPVALYSLPLCPAQPILSLQSHWRCAPSKISSETFSLCWISLPVACTYSLIFSFIQPYYSFHLVFSINSGWFI